MFRLLIEDITLLRDRTIQLHIRRKGGATTSLECSIPRGAPDLRRTPATIVEMVRALAAEHTDRQIADTLNGQWLRTGTGQRFTRLRVRHIRTAHGMPSLAEHLRQAGWLTAAEIATQLGVHHTTAKRFAREACSARSAPMTAPVCSLSRRRVRYPVPTRGSASATAAAFPSVHRTNGRSCSMKPDAWS
jgi:hypothetical protein